MKATGRKQVDEILTGRKRYLEQIESGYVLQIEVSRFENGKWFNLWKYPTYDEMGRMGLEVI